MKKILYFLITSLIWISCDQNDDVFFENPVTAGSIKLIRLRADHNMMLPDGKACMKFYPEAYNILELPNYTPDHSGDTTLYIPSVKRDTSLIPEDLLPEGLFRLVDEAGNEYPDFTFSTTDTVERTVRFHMEAGELCSNELEIRIRPLPKTEYEQIVIPVVFHILNPASQPSIAPIEITPETVQKNIDRLNAVFNGEVTTDPNGGVAKITFKLAEYDDNGIPMDQPGMHTYEIPKKEELADDDAYLAYIKSKGSVLMYDYKNFLNIWLINNPVVSSSLVTVPTVVDRLPNPIPGSDAGLMSENFPERATDIGFCINMSYFVNPMQSTDYFEISTIMAQYFGLLSTQVVENFAGTNFINGDTDYCEDTPYYWNNSFSVFKNNSKSGSGDNILYFTSYHVMDRYSYKNSISCDQVARIRLNLEHCPSRWMYKSKFAFTGKMEDKL